MVNKIFYQYFTFYRRYGDAEPILTAILTFSISQSFLVSGIHNVIIFKILREINPLWVDLTEMAVIIVMNYIYFLYRKKAKKLIKEKPLFFNSIIYSRILGLSFFICSLLGYFFLPIYFKNN